jgi:ABC-type dipeptide/oligopeptide/nickel transport system permease subunit
MSVQAVRDEAEELAEAPPAKLRRGSITAIRVRRFARNKLAVAAAIFVLIEVLVALFASVIAPANPNVQDLARRLKGPSAAHWLGTDQFGRDALSRLIFGARVSLGGAAIAVAIAVSAGVSLGLIAGYLRGWVDRTFSQVMDVVMSVPALILAVTIVGVLGPGLTNAMIAVGIATVPRFYRVTRAQTHVVAGETFIEAARAGGSSQTSIMLRHVLPNALSPVMVQVSLVLGAAVTAEASLSYIGLGVQPPTASWGSALREAAPSMSQAPALVIAPGVIIALTVLAFALAGDELREALGTGRESQVADVTI